MLYLHEMIEIQSMFSRKKRIDLLYIEGPGDVVESLKSWHSGEDLDSETSRTFSGQVFDFCRANNLSAIALSTYREAKYAQRGNIEAMSSPRRLFKGSLGYHLGQIINALYIICYVLRFRPKYLHLTSGCADWFTLSAIKLTSTKVFPHFHNTLWPAGFGPPRSLAKRFQSKLDSFFLRHVATAGFCCSAEIRRQIAEMTNHSSCPMFVFIPQFNRGFFNFKPPSFPQDGRPFIITFAGRVEENKGVFDLLKIADKLRQLPIEIHICGDGTSLAELKASCSKLNLDDSVRIFGRLNRTELIQKYNVSNAVIVPTRSTFAEGFAMVAAEAILLHRPIISTPVVPALELLKSAAVEATTNDVDSFVACIKVLSSDKQLYQSKVNACADLREQFLDGSLGLTEILKKSLPVR
jgi:glycogen synthase